MWLPQYGIPALTVHGYLKMLGRRPGNSVLATERVAMMEEADPATLIAAGRLSAVVWSIVGFACIPATILSAVLIGRNVAHDSWLNHVVGNLSPGLLSVTLGCMIVINFRLRAAERIRAVERDRGQRSGRNRADRGSVTRAGATPKRGDLAIVLVAAAILIALGNAATGSLG